ncbi:hypothetical protein HBH56_059960 [Parastagonospora nodorum]|nr:hypothetical protein HBH56_059960 [Parastagonospora nodorum]KAH3931023.1 hypothetical protein HBH54_103890 [Parastagonospora nodorum]KAH4140707.1 hypothetical protein HBH45_077860 [Parastagonospora nodorum]KAH4167868.1 hypothetical protein HBH44_053720 [Parastagonospora nodorum]KAH4178561.1 hypothetical protein HBH43_025730 [Parastagonospora nodorum]
MLLYCLVGLSATKPTVRYEDLVAPCSTMTDKRELKSQTRYPTGRRLRRPKVVSAADESMCDNRKPPSMKWRK